jgi:subtilisin
VTRARKKLADAHPAHLGHTGRHLVVLRGETGRAVADELRNRTGVRMAVSSDFDGSNRQIRLSPGEGVVFEGLYAALFHGDPDQARALVNPSDERTVVVEPERYVRASGLGGSGAPVMGQRAGASSNSSIRHPKAQRAALALPLADTAPATWGVQAVRTLACGYSGRGIRVAILDTGVHLSHPDFAGRTIVSRSFVTGMPVDDRNGHGTHSAGIACGPQRPGQAPRYGVACDADVYIGKVLDDDANGTDGNILAGIDWAVRKGCAVVSMSIGSPVLVGDPHSHVFEEAAARALAAGTLLIAAAGNESARPDTIVPVEHPANCPSILAVGALDHRLAVAPFSNAGLNADGGEVDLAAPGVAIISSWLLPALYQTENGTSPATPYAAGITALLAEANPAARGAALRALLLKSCLSLEVPVRDAGAGLVQSPQ